MATRESSIGRGIERASENILRAAMTRAQLDIDQQRVDLEARRVAAEEKGAALERIVTLAPLLKPGSTVADNPFIHSDLKTAFPEFDPARPDDLGGLVLRPETVDDILQPMIINALSDPNLDPAQRERIMNNALLGQPVTGQELETKRSIAELQGDAVQYLVGDQRAMENIGRSMFGLDQIVTLNLGGRQVSFDTSDAARLSVDIWRHSTMLDWDKKKFSMGSGEQADIAKEFMDLMEQKGVGITRAQATRIIQAVHSENAEENVNALRSSPGWNELQDTALQVYISGASLADETVNWVREQFPQFGAYLDVGNALAEFMPTEQVAEVLPHVARAMDKSGVDISTPRRFLGGFNLGPRAGAQTAPTTGQSAVQQEQQQAGIDISVMDPQVVDTAIREVIQTGEMTEQEIRTRYGDAVVDRALDPMSVLGPTPEPQSIYSHVEQPPAATAAPPTRPAETPHPGRMGKSEVEQRQLSNKINKLTTELRRATATLNTLQERRRNATNPQFIASYDRQIASQNKKVQEINAELMPLLAQEATR